MKIRQVALACLTAAALAGCGKDDPAPTESDDAAVGYPDPAEPGLPESEDEGELLADDVSYDWRARNPLKCWDLLKDSDKPFHCLAIDETALVPDDTFSPRTVIRFDRPFSPDEVFFLSGAPRGAWGHLEGSSMKDPARLQAHHVDKALSLVLVYGVEYLTGSRALPTGTEAPCGEPIDSPNYRFYCGDGAVTQLFEGVQAFAVITLRFDDLPARARYDERFPEAPGIRALSEWAATAPGSVSQGVAFVQVGGDPVLLGAGLYGEGANPAEVGCSFSDAACRTVLGKFMTYALGERADGIKDQAERVPGDLAVRITTHELLGGLPARELPADIVAVREALSARFDEVRTEVEPESEAAATAALERLVALEEMRDVCFFYGEPEVGEAQFEACRAATAGLL